MRIVETLIECSNYILLLNEYVSVGGTQKKKRTGEREGVREGGGREREMDRDRERALSQRECMVCLVIETHKFN